MTDTEIQEFAIKKVEELTLEIGDFKDTARVIQEMGSILKIQWFLKRKKKIEEEQGK